MPLPAGLAHAEAAATGQPSGMPQCAAQREEAAPAQLQEMWGEQQSSLWSSTGQGMKGERREAVCAMLRQAEGHRGDNGMPGSQTWLW